ncbi:hypothetical protein HPP92_026006 [Vanilla planifolia]|uniref:Uncharacterized protein n=1 Tax=Vanilla planifolia TaxID=51239 RepID=A0A835PNF6_VANPL|nr:hypothetical protein HPP92_026006 [Vanilla planifolia]
MGGRERDVGRWEGAKETLEDGENKRDATRGEQAIKEKEALRNSGRNRSDLQCLCKRDFWQGNQASDVKQMEDDKFKLDGCYGKDFGFSNT